jgi:hypothetical protein
LLGIPRRGTDHGPAVADVQPEHGRVDDCLDAWLNDARVLNVNEVLYGEFGLELRGSDDDGDGTFESTAEWIWLSDGEFTSFEGATWDAAVRKLTEVRASTPELTNVSSQST